MDKVDKKISLAVCGSSGRVGKTIIEVAGSKDFADFFEVVSSISSSSSDDEVARAPRGVNIMIDFSLPAGLGRIIAACCEHKIPIVSGVTGYSDSQMQAMEEAAKIIPVFWSPNFSIGANLVAEFARGAAAASTDFDIKITDIHHKDKRDMPSGTSLMIQGAIKSSTKIPVEVESIREGNLPGKHEIVFSNELEKISITHQATGRRVYAVSALKIARWIYGKKPGLYNMRDYIFSADR